MDTDNVRELRNSNLYNIPETYNSEIIHGRHEHSQSKDRSSVLWDNSE